MPDLVRASLVGSLVVAGVLGAAACWSVAPDSSKDMYLETGPGSVADVTFYDGPRGDGAVPQGDGGSPGDAPVGDGEGQAPLVILPAASPSLATGQAFGCSIDASGAVWCWGDNTFGQAGSTPGGTTGMQVVQGLTGATGLALGDHHACAVTASHAVYCWGLNGSYQLGHPAATAGDLICPGAVSGETVPCTPAPALVADVSPAVAIAAAGSWTCIVATDGSVQCWGGMQTPPTTTDAGVPCGQGTQPTGGSCYPAPTPIPGVTGATLLAVGADHACAVVTAGVITDAGNALACWGRNNEAQVSPTACPQSICTAPIARGDVPTTTSLVAGNAFTCALATDGSVRCFGDNTYGELGHTTGSSGDLGTPDGEGGLGVFNPGATTASATAVASLVGGGNQAACALLPTGAAECWGGTTGTSSAPVAVTGLPVLNALGTYDATYVCGVSVTDGSIWCWTMGGAAPAQVAPVAAGDAGEAG